MATWKAKSLLDNKQHLHFSWRQSVPSEVKLLEEKIYPDHVARAWVTYLIENGKIQKMWIERVK